MATVYLAMQQSLERQIALKTMRVDPVLEDEDPQETIFDDDLQGEQRFINEAKLVAAVKHPHVILSQLELVEMHQLVGDAQAAMQCCSQLRTTLLSTASANDLRVLPPPPVSYKSGHL